MQAIADRRTPNNNRLFMLDLDLQMQIFAYAGLFGDARLIEERSAKLRRLFENTRKEDLYYDKLYFVGLYASIAKELADKNRFTHCFWCAERLPIQKILKDMRICLPFLRSPFCESTMTFNDDGTEFYSNGVQYDCDDMYENFRGRSLAQINSERENNNRNLLYWPSARVW